MDNQAIKIMPPASAFLRNNIKAHDINGSKEHEFSSQALRDEPCSPNLPKQPADGVPMIASLAYHILWISEPINSSSEWDYAKLMT
jgi:hypothetical protein